MFANESLSTSHTFRHFRRLLQRIIAECNRDSIPQFLRRVLSRVFPPLWLNMHPRPRRCAHVISGRERHLVSGDRKFSIRLFLRRLYPVIDRSFIRRSLYAQSPLQKGV